MSTNLKQLFAALYFRLDFGATGFDASNRRRIRLINVGAILVSITNLGNATHYFFIDKELLLPAIIANLSFLAVAIVLPIVNRVPPLAGACLFFVSSDILVLTIAKIFGPDIGVHLFYFAIVAATFPMLHGSRLIFVVSNALAAIALYLLVEFYFPVGTVIAAMPGDFVTETHIGNVVGTAMLIFLCVYIAIQEIRRAEEIAEEAHELSEKLLRNILPSATAERLKLNPNDVIADYYGAATVLFADIIDFTPRASTMSPNDIVIFLNNVFSRFDGLAEHFGLEKIKTIGDNYMVVGGVPSPRSKQEDAMAVAEMAIKMLAVAKEMSETLEAPLQLRIGIHMGPLVAGVIGIKKFSYDVWGDTVNVAARMESTADPGTIQISEAVYNLLQTDFDCEHRGNVKIKGKGKMETYRLVSRN